MALGYVGALGALVSLNPGGLFLWVVAALIAGWLAGLLTRGRGFGCLGDIALGLLGALLGVFVLNQLPNSMIQGLGLTGQLQFLGTVVVAFLGAFALALIGRLIGGGRSGRTRRRYAEWPRRSRPARPSQRSRM